jgi:hypothetical protein
MSLFNLRITQNVSFQSTLEINSLADRPVCVCSEKGFVYVKRTIAVSSFVVVIKIVIGPV